MNDGISSLGGLRYPARAHDVVRFLDHPVDEQIAAIVADAAQLADEPRDALRASVSEEDAYTLLEFARRRAASALRTTSLPQALEAVRSLTLVTRSRIDYRDLSVDFPLYAVRELGGDLGRVVQQAIAMSEPSTGEYFAARASPARRESLRDCALVEVRSSYGLGFMDHISGRYRPSADLAETAVRLADMIDTDARYVVEDLHTSDLPEVWFTLERRTGSLPATGCVSLSATLSGADRWSHGLLVFLAEMASRRAASRLIARAKKASTDDRPRLATSSGRCVGLIIGGSSTHGEKAVESSESLARFRDLSVAAFGGAP